MDKETDKILDQFTKKILKDFPKETPSMDFTTKLMSKVESLSDATATTYKPLISKRWWFFLAMLIAGIFMYLIFGKVEMESTWAMSDVLDLLPKMNSIELPNYQVSNVFIYGVLGFTFFVSIQIFMFKNYFDRHFA